MINVSEVLRAIPHFETFCSVQALNILVDRLRADSRFEITVAGTSARGVPIHHVRYGKGSTKALFVGGPHAHEPIGSLTVHSLMTLLHQDYRALTEKDVEWHIVPCIDPDGATLNEGWTQKPFTLENYVHNFYVQPPKEQVDCTFPISYKKLVFNQPSPEAKVLKGVLDRVRPDFFHSLHNGFAGGGTFYLLARDVGGEYCRQLQQLLDESNIALNLSSFQGSYLPEFGKGIYQVNTARRHYDYLEQNTTLSPETEMSGLGANSIEYLVDIKNSAQVLVTELTYLRHPHDGSAKQTGQEMRQLKLRIDADNRFLVATILEEWDKLKEELDATSPFYRKIELEIIAVRDKLDEGPLPLSGENTRDLLVNPKWSRPMTENDRLFAWLWTRLMPLGHGYAFVRLLKASRQTPALQQSVARLERVFDEALGEVARHTDVAAFEAIDCDTLARVQLGSGLIVLNSVLEARGQGL